MMGTAYHRATVVPRRVRRASRKGVTSEMASTDAQLLARIAELETENARLRAISTDITNEGGDGSAEAGAGAVGGRHRARSIVSVTMIVIALLLAPLALVAGFARIQLTDTDAFVATFAPLADDPAVQADVQEAVVGAINDSVDIPGLTAHLFDGLDQLDMPENARNALGLLQAPAVSGIQSLIQNLVGEFVRSDAFSDTWRQALTVSHEQIVATMTNDPDSALTITAEGGLVLNLRPIIAEVRERLVDSGLSLAERIPDIDRSIVLTESESLRQAQVGYNLVVAVGTWLPFVAMALLAAGVLVAVNRRATLMRSGVALGVLMLLLWMAIAIGRVVVVGQVSPSRVSVGTATLLYDTLLDQITRSTIAVGLLGIIIALVALFTGPSRFATRTREVSESLSTGIREAGERHGLSTGPVGRVLDRYHGIAFAVVAAIAIAVIAFARPLTPATVLWTCVLALVALFVIQVLRTPSNAGQTADPDLAAAGT